MEIGRKLDLQHLLSPTWTEVCPWAGRMWPCPASTGMWAWPNSLGLLWVKQLSRDSLQDSPWKHKHRRVGCCPGGPSAHKQMGGTVQSCVQPCKNVFWTRVGRKEVMPHFTSNHLCVSCCASQLGNSTEAVELWGHGNGRAQWCWWHLPLCQGRGAESSLSSVQWPGDVPSHWQTPPASPVLGESCVDAQPPATNPQFLLLCPRQSALPWEEKKKVLVTDWLLGHFLTPQSHQGDK